jgi:hypothetical protein
MSARPQKITFREMRQTGATRIVDFCQDYQCSHNVQMDASQWPDELQLSDLEPRFTCRVCGKRGSIIGSVNPPAKMGAGLCGEIAPYKWVESSVIQRCDNPAPSQGWGRWKRWSG